MTNQITWIASRIGKGIVRAAGYVLALPALVSYVMLWCLFGKDRAFSLTSERLGGRSGMLGLYIRQAFYRCTTAGVGRDVNFGFMTVFSKPAVRLGDGICFGRFCIIGWVDIGADVMVADGSKLLSGSNQHGSIATEGGSFRDNVQQYKKITIGRGAWIGAGAVVMADVGERAVVGAGAVVVKPVPADARVGGVPAKPLGQNSRGDRTGDAAAAIAA